MIKLSELIFNSYEELKKEAVSTKWISNKIRNGGRDIEKNFERDLASNPRAKQLVQKASDMSRREYSMHAFKRPDDIIRMPEVVFAKNSPSRIKLQRINKIYASKKYGPSLKNSFKTTILGE